MLARIRKAEESDKGFTLIELLVVVIIIGILSAIAIPTFLKQREKGWDKAARADLRNNAIKMEEYLDDNGVYPATAVAGFKQSDNVGPTAAVLPADAASGYCIHAVSTKINATGATAVGGKQSYKLTNVSGKPELGICT